MWLQRTQLNTFYTDRIMAFSIYSFLCYRGLKSVLNKSHTIRTNIWAQYYNTVIRFTSIGRMLRSHNLLGITISEAQIIVFSFGPSGKGRMGVAMVFFNSTEHPSFKKPLLLINFNDFAFEYYFRCTRVYRDRFKAHRLPVPSLAWWRLGEEIVPGFQGVARLSMVTSTQNISLY